MSSGDQQPLNTTNEYQGDEQIDKRHRKPACTGYCCCKYLALIYAFFLLVVGLLLLCLGVTVELIRRDYEGINDYLRSPSVMCIVVGILMVLASVIGIIGVTKEKLILLKIFLGLIIIIFLLQVAVGILAFVFREQTAGVLKREVKLAIVHYNNKKIVPVRIAVDAVQRNFDCCGMSNPNSWDYNDVYSCKKREKLRCGLPTSCCVKGKEDSCRAGIRQGKSLKQLKSYGIKTQGCLKKLTEWIERHLDIVGATTLGFAIPKVLAILIVWLLITKVEDRIHLFDYNNYRKKYGTPPVS